MAVIAARTGPPAGWRLALQTCRKPANLRRTTTIALVVGTIFTALNQIGPFVHGTGTWVTGLKAAMNYLVPFIVSNFGVMTAAWNRS